VEEKSACPRSVDSRSYSGNGSKALKDHTIVTLINSYYLDSYPMTIYTIYTIHYMLREAVSYHSQTLYPELIYLEKV
jgi:hypothetical protein